MKNFKYFVDESSDGLLKAECFGELCDVLSRCGSNAERMARWKMLQVRTLESVIGIYSRGDQSFEKNLLPSLHRAIDAVVWNLVENQIADIRRLYHDPPSSKDLRSHNIEFHQKIADQINGNDESIGIISDLTSGIYLGDIVMFPFGNNLFHPMECKAGKVNQEIMDVLAERDRGDDTRYSGILSQPKSKTAKQLLRMERQFRTLNSEIQTYLNWKSEPSTVDGYYLSILPDTRKPKFFHQELSEVISAAAKVGIASIEIVGGLKIVALSGRGDLEDGAYLKELSGFDSSDYTMLYPWRDYLFGTNFSLPLYVQNLTTDQKWLVYSGNVLVFLVFSIKKFADLLSADGFKCEFVMGKALRREMQNKMRPFPPCVIGRSMLRISPSPEIVWEFSEGLIYRLIGQLETPNSLAEMFKSEAVQATGKEHLVSKKY